MAKVKFVVKGKSEFSGAFWHAFEKMEASFSKAIMDDDRMVTRFEVTCDADKIDLLDQLVPRSAYASVGFG